MNCRRNADNITGTDRSCQSRAQGFKAVYVTIALILGREDELQSSRQFRNLQ